MVNLKKAYSPAFSAPEPIPAKIPRPKFARYSPTVEQAETPDEVEEAVDRLTPLRSEMRPLTGLDFKIAKNKRDNCFKKSLKSIKNVK